MKYKVADLKRPLLDAAVAKALGLRWRIDDDTIVYVKGRKQDPEQESAFCPSMYGDHGVPIIERERISLDAGDTDWTAYAPMCVKLGIASQDGPTSLIAAMRAFVTSKFGEEVEL